MPHFIVHLKKAQAENWRSLKNKISICTRIRTRADTRDSGDQRRAFSPRRVFHRSEEEMRPRVNRTQVQVQPLFCREDTVSGVSRYWVVVSCGSCQSFAGFCLCFVYSLTQLEPKESAAEAGVYLSAESAMFDVSEHFCKHATPTLSSCSLTNSSHMKVQDSKTAPSPHSPPI